MTFPALTAAIGRYPHTAGLLEGRLAPLGFRLSFADIPVISRAFAPMVREARFDISEMAIATLLQARCHDKPIVLLPVTLAARDQEGALLCRADSAIRAPGDLAGRRVGVRAYSQTTGMWLRGIMAERDGLPPEAVRWLTFEDAHVAEVRDPPWATRAAPGQDMLAMLRAGEIDAAIVGNDVPADPALRTVYADPAAAGADFRRRHGFRPVNHLLTVSRDLAERQPQAVAEVVRLFRAAADDAPADAAIRAFPDKASLEPAIALALRYMSAQGMLSRPLAVADVWQDLPAGIA